MQRLYEVHVVTEKFLCSGLVLASNEAEAGRLIEDRLRTAINEFVRDRGITKQIADHAFKLKSVSVQICPPKVLNFSWDLRALPDQPPKTLG